MQVTLHNLKKIQNKKYLKHITYTKEIKIKIKKILNKFTTNIFQYQSKPL